jgi:GTP-binding protein Era
METKSVFVTISGRTNVGKSSLLNAIVGERIASVSDKPQTTRTRITGIKTTGAIQMVFMDTPGLHKPKNKLSNYMLQAAKEAVSEMDVVLFVADCTRQPNEQEIAFLQPLRNSKTTVILVLNKIDLLEEKTVLMQRIAAWNNAFPFSEIIPISVREADGVSLVEEAVCRCAVPSPHYFPDDKITDQPEQVLIAEMIREQILQLLRDEVPHGVAVAVERLSERDDKDILDIDAIIYCERDSHKGIIIGKKGAMLKQIATRARMQLEQFFQIQVNLQCWVKVKEDWRNREGLIRNFGLGDCTNSQ